jgi:hypothetical protein
MSKNTQRSFGWTKNDNIEDLLSNKMNEYDIKEKFSLVNKIYTIKK